MSTISLRAIPSSIAQKSTPAIPPASQAFEPFSKGVLQKRFSKDLLVNAAVVSWIQAVVAVVWGLGGVQALSFTGLATVWISPLVLAVTLGIWVMGSLPVVVSRKLSMSASRAVAISPAKTLSGTLPKPASRTAFITYVSSSILLTIIHVSLEHMNGHDPRLTLFVKSKKHPYYLNGRLLFLLLSQVVLACTHFSRNALTDRFVFRWTAARTQISTYVISVFLVVLLLPAVSIPVSTVLFAVGRLALPIIFKIPILAIFLRPFMAHFTRGYVLLQPWKHIPLVVRAWALASSTLITWETAEVLFDTQISQPIPCSHLFEVDLVAGAGSQDRVFQYFALRELQNIASSGDAPAAARRSTLFADQKYSPNMWTHLLRNALLLLGTDYQHLLRRGQPPPPAPPPVATAPTKAQSPLPATPVKVGMKPIYKPSPSESSPLRQVIKSLASDGSMARAIDEVGVGDLIKKVEGKVEASAAPAVTAVVPARTSIVSKATKSVKTLVEKARLHIPAINAVEAGINSWTKWYTAPRIDKEAEMVLPMREIDLVVVEVISHLTCASLKEDTYGVVQRDIPRILEALVSFLEAAEAYRVELLGREGDDSEKAKAKDVVDGICEGLRASIRRIVQTFGAKLTAFKFPPRTASRLQNFVDYI